MRESAVFRSKWTVTSPVVMFARSSAPALWSPSYVAFGCQPEPPKLSHARRGDYYCKEVII
jgi:hypothetical protein